MNKTNWVKTNSALWISEENAVTANGKATPAYKLVKDGHSHQWQLCVWDSARNGYRYSQRSESTLLKIRTFFRSCKLDRVGLYLDEM